MKRLPSFLITAFILGIAVCFAAAGPTTAQEGSAGGGSAIKSLAGCAASNIPANDDGSTGLVALPFTLNFFGSNYDSLYVNNNGNVTFDSALPAYTPFSLLSTTRVIIAPFFADVDTRGTGSGLTTYGTTSFSGRSAFCVSWVGVGYYTHATNRLNSFQLLLVDRTDRGIGDFDIIFNYNQVQWEAGSASGGIDGLGGSSARAGYSNGVDTALELPGSAINGALLDTSASGLTNNSRGSLIPGRFIFEVRNGVAPVGGELSGFVYRNDLGGETPVSAARVQACFTGQPPTPCQVTSTNANGIYQFSGLPGNGNYFVTAFPPGASTTLGPRTIGAIFMPGGGAQVTDQNIKLIPSVLPPPDVHIDTPFQAGDGTPAINSATGAPFTQTGACTGGSGSWSITQNGMVLASGVLTEGPPGTYSGTIPPMPGRNGRATMNITISCPGGVGSKDDDFDVYIDPSGHVTNSLDDSPIEGATATLYRSDSEVGPFEQVPEGDAIMSPSNRTNPDLTDAEGYYRWDVIAGYYKVRVEKAGCHAPGNAGQSFVESDVLPVPPPQFDVDLQLECAGGPGPTPTFTPTSQGPPPTSTPPGATSTPIPPTPTRTPTSQGTATPLPPEGDANCNGIVNSIDVAIILQYVAALLENVQCFPFADVNDDGQVNTIDAALILQFIAGLLGSL